MPGASLTRGEDLVSRYSRGIERSSPPESPSSDRSEAEAARVARGLALLEETAGIMPGHWESPYPSQDEIDRACFVYEDPPGELPGIDLAGARQLQLVEELAPLQHDIELPAKPDPAWRYYYENPYFGLTDGEALCAMLRHLRPSRVIEVGSGFSSALILDTNERFLERRVELVFIEPEPARLKQLLRPGDDAQVEIIEGVVQDVPLETFDTLRPGDILFIDSSHITKMGSDVNMLFFEVLPRLAPGTHVHVHDIFYPFEYPRKWIETSKFARSEAYLLRAFLQYNPAFQIRLFLDYLRRLFRQEVGAVYPRLTWGAPGSLWMDKVA
jgi:predicted O-methyltransferase YrrM